MRILSIDPGTTHSAYTVYAETDLVRHVAEWGKLENYDLLNLLLEHRIAYDTASIERLACYGMAVGKEVFETAFWTGRFIMALACKSGSYFRGHEPLLIERREVKMHLCNSMKAKDGNIRQALIDLLGPQGTKSKPGPTYSVSGDGWASLGVAVTTANKLKLALSQL